MIDKFFEVLTTEYGVFVSFLFVSLLVLLFIINKLWKQILHLNEKLVEIIENNTKVLTEIQTKLERYNDHHDT